MISKTKIALVEDNYYFGKNLAEILFMNDFEVKIFKSISEAEDELEDFNPDVLLIDLMLSDGNSTKYISVLRNQRKFNYMPIILITGSVSIDIHFFYSLGVSEVVFKPAKSDLLVRIIKRYVKKKNSLTYIKRSISFFKKR